MTTTDETAPDEALVEEVADVLATASVSLPPPRTLGDELQRDARAVLAHLGLTGGPTTEATTDVHQALAAALAQRDALAAHIVTLKRIIGWLRADVRALGARRDTIRRDAQRELLRLLDAPTGEPAVPGQTRQEILEPR